MNKSNVITLRVPLDLKQRLVLLAKEQGVSLNQLAVYALTKEATMLENSGAWKAYIGKSQEELEQGFDAVMAKVRDGDIPDWDKMPED